MSLLPTHMLLITTWRGFARPSNVANWSSSSEVGLWPIPRTHTLIPNVRESPFCDNPIEKVLNEEYHWRVNFFRETNFLTETRWENSYGARTNLLWLLFGPASFRKQRGWRVTGLRLLNIRLFIGIPTTSAAYIRGERSGAHVEVGRWGPKDLIWFFFV